MIYVHDTRSEPGEPSKHSNVHYRKAMMKERKGACPKTSQVTAAQGNQVKEVMEETTKKKRVKAVSQTGAKAVPSTSQTRVQSDEGESVFNHAESVVTASSERPVCSNDKLRSGFLDKPRSTVLVKLTWPHMSQNPRYVTSPLSFNQLTFPQFVGGEAQTILKTDDITECYG